MSDIHKVSIEPDGITRKATSSNYPRLLAELIRSTTIGPLAVSTSRWPLWVVANVTSTSFSKRVEKTRR